MDKTAVPKRIFILTMVFGSAEAGTNRKADSVSLTTMILVVKEEFCDRRGRLQKKHPEVGGYE